MPDRVYDLLLKFTERPGCKPLELGPAMNIRTNTNRPEAFGRILHESTGWGVEVIDILGNRTIAIWPKE